MEFPRKLSWNASRAISAFPATAKELVRAFIFPLVVTLVFCAIPALESGVPDRFVFWAERLHEFPRTLAARHYLIVFTLVLTVLSFRAKLIPTKLERIATALPWLYALAFTLLLISLAFRNAFQNDFTTSDAHFQIQSLYNMVKGYGPEQSAKFYAAFPDSSFHYQNVFAHQGSYWLPYLLVAPLYALNPHPPMHVVGVIAWLAPGLILSMYWCCRQLKASRTLAFIAAVAYSILPHVEILLFNRGYLEVFSLAFMPVMLGSAFGQRWKIYLVSVAALCLTSIGHVYIAAASSVLVFLLTQQRRTAIIALGLCFFVWWIKYRINTHLWDLMHPGVPLPGLVSTAVKETGPQGAEVLAQLQRMGWYFLFLVVALSGLPLFPSTSRHFRMGCLLAAGILAASTAMAFLRWNFWHHHRNALLIVPLFVLGMTRLIEWESEPRFRLRFHAALASFVATVYVFSAVMTKYYPWTLVEKPYLFWTSSQLDYVKTKLQLIKSMVPEDARLVFWVQAPFQAELANRRHVWYATTESVPRSDFVVLSSDSDAGRSLAEAIEGGCCGKLTQLFSDHQLRIYRNDDPNRKAPNRLDEVLTWRSLLDAVVPF